jgi:hypothetical protein
MTVFPEAVTDSVATENVAYNCPEGTATLAGTVARVVTELERVTDAPPEGATAFNVTVPVTPCPPATLLRLSDTERSSGRTVNFAVFGTPA